MMDAQVRKRKQSRLCKISKEIDSRKATMASLLTHRLTIGESEEVMRISARIERLDNEKQFLVAELSL